MAELLTVGGLVPKRAGNAAEGPAKSVAFLMYQSNEPFNLLFRKAASTPRFKVELVIQVSCSLISPGKLTEACCAPPNNQLLLVALDVPKLG
ncbi:hypothetical protein D3C87_1343340 [compost metagenome]